MVNIAMEEVTMMSICVMSMMVSCMLSWRHVVVHHSIMSVEERWMSVGVMEISMVKEMGIMVHSQIMVGIDWVLPDLLIVVMLEVVRSLMDDLSCVSVMVDWWLLDNSDLVSCVAIPVGGGVTVKLRLKVMGEAVSVSVKVSMKAMAVE